MRKDTFPRRTQIIATLGPSSDTFEMVEALYLAGVDIFRLNFSHGTHDNHRHLHDLIHKVRVKHSASIGILADLQGPKHRTGSFATVIPVGNEQKPGTFLHPGQEFQFDLDPAPGNHMRVNLPHPEIIQELQINQNILLDDGRVKARVTGKGDGFLKTAIVYGKILTNNKGFNVPELSIPLPAITEKDRRDAEFAQRRLGADWLALSFVQSADDVGEALSTIKIGHTRILSKIEKPQAVENMIDIINVSDAVMIARGDLSVEMENHKVPMVQRTIVRLCRMMGKPALHATQVMTSMTVNPRATAAEISDASWAVFQGASGIMTSEETASGADPLCVIQSMEATIRDTESYVYNKNAYRQRELGIKGLEEFNLMDPEDNLPEPVPFDTWHKRRQHHPDALAHLVPEPAI